MIHSKSRLAVILSKLKGFEAPSDELEQYTMDSEVAAEIIWNAHLSGDIEGKSVADFGCGTGILGIGALLLGAKRVHFIDIDEKAIALAKENLKNIQDQIKKNFLNYSFFLSIDIVNFNEKIDTVLTNPPFGVKKKHADKPFLEKAFEIADRIYYIHKEESADFIKAMAKDHTFDLLEMCRFKFPIKATQIYHTKPLHRFKAAWFKLDRRAGLR